MNKEFTANRCPKSLSREQLMTPDKRDLSRSHSTGKNPQKKFRSRGVVLCRTCGFLPSLWVGLALIATLRCHLVPDFHCPE
jgi:hypothetical protein